MVPVSLEADNLHTLLDYSYNFGNFVATRLAAAPTLAVVGKVDSSAAAAQDSPAVSGDMFVEIARVDTDYNPLRVAPVGMADIGPDKVLVPVVRSLEVGCNIAAVVVGDILLSASVGMFVVLAAAVIGTAQLGLV